jgi:hypothetical protein
MHINPILSHKIIESTRDVTLITNPNNVCDNFNIDIHELVFTFNQKLNCESRIISGGKYIIITKCLEISDVRKIFTKYARLKNKNHLIREIYKLDISSDFLNKIASSSGKDLKLTTINKVEDILFFFKTDICSFINDLENILNCAVYDYDVKPVISLEGYFELKEIKECLSDKVLVTRETFIPKIEIETCQCCDVKKTIFKNPLIICNILNISIEQLIEKFKNSGLLDIDIDSQKTEFAINHYEISASEINNIIFNL